MSLGRSVSRSGGFLPELAGELRRRIVQDGLEVTGPNVSRPVGSPDVECQW